MAYTVGTKTFFKGTEITITTEPYELYGGFFQDGIDDAGKIITVATPGQIEKDVKKERKQWNEQQAAFSAMERT